jgi:hypothetical protein
VTHTACKDCRNVRVEGPNLYDKRCNAAPINHFDAFNGVWKHAGYQYIGEVNMGNCPLFRPRDDIKATE